MANRSTFSGKLGFILVAIGATIGLGSLWRFPYLVAENGGGIFILLFLLFCFGFGIPLLITEFAIGRKIGAGTLNAYGSLHPKFRFLGVLAIVGLVLIQAYYQVISAWMGKYAFLYLTGNGEVASTEGYFQEFAGSFEPIFWLVLVSVLTVVIILLGLQKGLERASKFLLPIAVVLLIIFAIVVLSIPQAAEGVAYYLTPNLETFTVTTPLSALGQVFFCLSLGMGIMVMIGSYTAKSSGLVKTAGIACISIAIISFIAGLSIIPICFAATGGVPSEMGAGIVCESLPLLLNNISTGGVMGSLFFLVLFIASMLSNICATETIVSALVDRFKLSRILAIILTAVPLLLMSIVVSLGYGPLQDINLYGNNLLDICDTISGNLILPLVALLTCILVGYFVKPDIIFDEIAIGTGAWVQKFRKVFRVLIRYIMPVFITVILVNSIIHVFI